MKQSYGNFFAVQFQTENNSLKIFCMKIEELRKLVIRNNCVGVWVLCIFWFACSIHCNVWQPKYHPRISFLN